MSTDFKNNIKNVRKCHLTTSYFPYVTVQNHILDSLQCEFAIKSLPSVLLSSSTVRNFNNSETHICHFMRNEK